MALLQSNRVCCVRDTGSPWPPWCRRCRCTVSSCTERYSNRSEECGRWRNGDSTPHSCTAWETRLSYRQTGMIHDYSPRNATESMIATGNVYVERTACSLCNVSPSTRECRIVRRHSSLRSHLYDEARLTDGSPVATPFRSSPTTSVSPSTSPRDPPPLGNQLLPPPPSHNSQPRASHATRSDVQSLGNRLFVYFSFFFSLPLPFSFFLSSFSSSSFSSSSLFLSASIP